METIFIDTPQDDKRLTRIEQLKFNPIQLHEPVSICECLRRFLRGSTKGIHW